MSLLDVFKKNYADTSKSNNILTYFEISSNEWKKIINEFLTPIIEKELHLKQVSDYVWANNYNDLGMRKVLSLYFINNSYATLKWGWNFEFIPKSVGSKLVWAKTDKSIYTYIFEFSEAFYNSDYTDNKKKEAYEKTIVSRTCYYNKNIETGIENIIRHHQEVFWLLVPAIREYYHATETLQEVLNRINNNMNHWYYSFMNPELEIIKIFVEYRLGQKEKAEIDFENICFQSEEVKKQYKKKLHSI